MISDVKQIFMYLLGLCVSSLEKCHFKSFAPFWIRLFGFSFWVLEVLYVRYHYHIRYVNFKYFLSFCGFHSTFQNNWKSFDHIYEVLILGCILFILDIYVHTHTHTHIYICQPHIILITKVLQQVMQSESVNPKGLLFFYKIVLVIWGLLRFYMNFRVRFSTFTHTNKQKKEIIEDLFFNL